MKQIRNELVFVGCLLVLLLFYEVFTENETLNKSVSGGGANSAMYNNRVKHYEAKLRESASSIASSDFSSSSSPHALGDGMIKLPWPIHVGGSSYLYLFEAILNPRLHSITIFPLTDESFYDFYKFGKQQTSNTQKNKQNLLQSNGGDLIQPIGPFTDEMPRNHSKRRHLEINFELDETYFENITSYLQFAPDPCKGIFFFFFFFYAF